MFLLTRQLTIEKYDEIKIVEKLFFKLLFHSLVKNILEVKWNRNAQSKFRCIDN